MTTEKSIIEPRRVTISPSPLRFAFNSDDDETGGSASVQEGIAMLRGNDYDRTSGSSKRGSTR